MIPQHKIEATMRFLGCDRMQAINHERQRAELLRRRREPVRGRVAQ